MRSNPKKVGTVTLRFAGRIIEVLSTSLYPTAMHGFAEIITNAINACIRKGLAPPRVEIFRFKDKIIVRDHGDGFTYERFKNFFEAGESPELKDQRQDAQFNVGKFGPFAFAKRYTVRSNADNTSTIITFELDFDQLVKFKAGEEIKLDYATDTRGNHEYDPPSGTFSTFIIEDLLKNAPTEDQIIDKLPSHLPILDDWYITVGTKILPHRSFVGHEIKTSYDSLAGPVDVSIAIAEQANQDVDLIHLAAGGGRLLCPLRDIAGARKLFAPQTFDFRLTGYINVPGWKKGAQTASRSAVKASVAESEQMQSIAEGFNIHIVPTITRRLNALDNQSYTERLGEVVEECVAELQETFGFRKPPSKDGSGNAKSGGTPRTKDRKQAEYQRNLGRFVMEDTEFLLWHIKASDDASPTILNRHSEKPTIFVVTNNPTYLRLSRNRIALKQFLLRELVAAATLYFNGSNLSDEYVRSFHNNYRRVEEILAKKKKK